MVAWLAASAVDGYQQNGVLACAKHFPGHGDTSVDSHLALPTVMGDWERLSSVELVPFRSVIEAGAGSIMTTHICFPALDASAPATLSAPLLTGLLRNRMEYPGIVITDCLEMDAIAKTVGTAQGAVRAIQAGADVALVCHTHATQAKTIDALLTAVENGDIPESRLNEAVGRVLEAKRNYAAESETATEPWNDPAHDDLEQRIAAASIVVVRNSGAIPIRSANKPILVVSAHPAGLRLAELLSVRIPGVERVTLKPDFPNV
jgi:beta-N-acetylhexosaminidase